MTRAESRVVIVGGGLAGTRTAEGLRDAGHRGPITVVAAERHLPYDRPGLSKDVLAGRHAPERLRFRSADEWAAIGVDLMLGCPAVATDIRGRTVVLTDGTTLPFGDLVIASGAAPRRLPGTATVAGVHTLRTVDDVLAVRAALARPSPVVVIGAGVLGCEVAATLGTAGHDVTVVETEAGPLWAALGGARGRTASDRVGTWHTRHGVRLLLKRRVAGLQTEAGRVSGVALTDGARLPAAVVVVAIGAAPVTGWLDGSGVPLADGVVGDQHCSVKGTEGVWAVGDVARFDHGGRSERDEHWTGAVDMARIVATNILAQPGDRVPYVPSGYVWTDQYGLKLQIVGRPCRADRSHPISADDDTGKFLVLYSAHGRLVGAAGAGHARAVVGARAAISAGVPIDEYLVGV
ncbi:NAD(P)/FAD-dependent oxidoreductase [Micromonospora sp. DT233]|uniref:NAD(P)/FAD-dependent oxidoreductase n=1 Tax=Micromonospora sp. DT233 TaxID=3393432 RepID=UPI003CEF3AAD